MNVQIIFFSRRISSERVILDKIEPGIPLESRGYYHISAGNVNKMVNNGLEYKRYSMNAGA